MNIAIIGAGNIGLALANGLLYKNIVRPEMIFVTRRRLQLLEGLSMRGVRTSTDNLKAVQESDVVVFAVKPKQIKPLLTELKPALIGKTLISFVTGLKINDIRTIVGDNIKIARAMPNTAMALCESMTCLATEEGDTETEKLTLDLFGKLGKAILIPEDQMEAATVLGATGIAFALRYVRASTQGGIEIGFGSATAQMIAAQTVKGAAALLFDKGQHPESEIDKVTTPQGITISGLNEMEHKGFSSALIKGILTSFNKIEQIKSTLFK